MGEGRRGDDRLVFGGAVGRRGLVEGVRRAENALVGWPWLVGGFDRDDLPRVRPAVSFTAVDSGPENGSGEGWGRGLADADHGAGRGGDLLDVSPGLASVGDGGQLSAPGETDPPPPREN